jgi:hypothetical protein
MNDTDLESLPYDLLHAGRRLVFDLGSIFPHLSYAIIEKLDRSLFDELFNAQIKSNPDRMGDNATKDFILRHVFGIAAELINKEVHLLKELLRIHYAKTNLPKILSDRIIFVLKEQKGFQDWPLEMIVPDEKCFFAFLQERWPLYLESINVNNKVQEDKKEASLSFTGPNCLPFDHQDIKVYIDNLFVEGQLHPIVNHHIKLEPKSWARIGLIEDKAEEDNTRINRLFEVVALGKPSLESRHTDWVIFSQKWAELSALIHCTKSDSNLVKFREFSEKVNSSFANWLINNYASLINLPPTNPPMLHHVARRLAREIESVKGSSIALLVVDGLALDQWVTIRQILQKQDSNLVIRESATFAWVPTLTSVSRQAIFSGKPPMLFPASINSTNSEGKLWQQFWEENNLSRLDISYQRGLADGIVEKILEENLRIGKTKVIGLVVDKIDKIMHGMQLGSAGMHNQIKQWCEGGFLNSLIGYLLGHGFQVWLTADHGNIECKGKGRPSEGVIAETKGERVRVYPTPELRAQVASKYSFAKEWSTIGLPPKYYPLVASGNDAFITPDETIVGHGGISIEEVIVPLIKFERRQ